MKACLVLACCLLLSPLAMGKDVERTDFKFSVPDGVKVGQETAVANNKETYRSVDVDLPSGHGLLIFAYASKAAAEKGFAEWVRKYKTEQFTGATESPSKLCDKLGGKATLIKGSFLELDCCCEVGVFAGKQKGFVFVCPYSANDKRAVDKILRQITTSFTIRD